MHESLRNHPLTKHPSPKGGFSKSFQVKRSRSGSRSRSKQNKIETNQRLTHTSLKYEVQDSIERNKYVNNVRKSEKLSPHTAPTQNHDSLRQDSI